MSLRPRGVGKQNASSMYPRCRAASERPNVNVTFPLSRHRHRCACAAPPPPRRPAVHRRDPASWNRKHPMLIVNRDLDANPFNVINY